MTERRLIRWRPNNANLPMTSKLGGHNCDAADDGGSGAGVIAMMKQIATIMVTEMLTRQLDCECRD